MNIQLQILGSLLRAIAEEMGAVLVRSAFSANIKERRDCSTALFDERGRMIAQAEHIPVHLGAMPDAVAAVMTHEPQPGQVWAVNDPYTGGTHLPDITLVSRTDAGFAVTRAHHADVGGREPGSMPADSRTLAEEGVVIPPTLLDDAALARLVGLMRNPDERRGDLRAQLAAHRLAEQRVADLCAARGKDTVTAAMDELYAYSERVMRAGIAALPDGRYEAADVLEPIAGALELCTAVTIAGDTVAIDFGGTSPQHEGNLNCPLSVARSACFYVVRVLVAPDVPASGGAFAPVSVSAPPGCLVNARPPAAVAAGNVETSSRIVDVVMRAFGEAIDVPAQGQGTMNNVTLGNDRFTYYETIGGGQGACPDADGPSGVHVAMSNTLSTPVEALELQYPLRVERYGLRLGSGGDGAHRGGDGVVRELRVLEDCRLSIISDRRAHAPQGQSGGRPGSPGRNLVDGEPAGAKITRDLAAGDVVTVETPGGGGWGVRLAPMSGRVEGIFVTPEHGELPEPVGTVRALAGRGLEGNRYFYDEAPTGKAITLIAAEAVEAMEREHGIALEPAESRRNVVTRGIDVNELVGKRFRVGAVECRGVELCEPCTDLQAMTKPGVIKGLAHRGGLNADILSDGQISVGDAVVAED